MTSVISLRLITVMCKKERGREEEGHDPVSQMMSLKL